MRVILSPGFSFLSETATRDSSGHFFFFSLSKSLQRLGMGLREFLIFQEWDSHGFNLVLELSVFTLSFIINHTHTHTQSPNIFVLLNPQIYFFFLFFFQGSNFVFGFFFFLVFQMASTQIWVSTHEFSR